LSFFTDLFKGNFGNLGTDVEHAPESLIKHPDELAETVGGAIALGTGGLGLAGIGPLGGLLGGTGEALGSGLGGLFSTGADLVPDAFTSTAAAEPFSETAGQQAITGALSGGSSGGGDLSGYGFGSNFLGVSPTTPTVGLNDFGPLAGGGDITGSVGGPPAVAPPTAPTTGFQLGDPSTWLPAAGKTIAANPLQYGGAALGAGVLGYDLLKGNKPLPEQATLQAESAELSAQGQQFRSYLASGTLPPGLQTLVDKQTQAAKAMAISNAAKNGQSTDPTTNTQLADAINSAQQQATAQVAQIGASLYSQGLSTVEVSSKIMEYLTKLDEDQTAKMGQSIMNFAAALAGGGKKFG
jgi:hypothetical protein